MKEFISDIKRNWKETPNSVKFWNGLVLLGLIIIGIIDLEALGAVLGLMSIATLAVLLRAIGDGDCLENHLWIWFTPLAWFMLIMVLILYGCHKFYEKIIMKFNNWLNN
jgi:uncharacterized BrkB/YihY/UPF0761 family membrane protein